MEFINLFLGFAVAPKVGKVAKINTRGGWMTLQPLSIDFSSSKT
jgi:hypothetical protein